MRHLPAAHAVPMRCPCRRGKGRGGGSALAQDVPPRPVMGGACHAGVEHAMPCHAMHGVAMPCVVPHGGEGALTCWTRAAPAPPAASAGCPHGSCRGCSCRRHCCCCCCCAWSGRGSGAPLPPSRTLHPWAARPRPCCPCARRPSCLPSCCPCRCSPSYPSSAPWIQPWWQLASPQGGRPEPLPQLLLLLHLLLRLDLLYTVRGHGVLMLLARE
jgi:hypothetical protein